jgi:hypothetical protein
MKEHKGTVNKKANEWVYSVGAVNIKNYLR